MSARALDMPMYVSSDLSYLLDVLQINDDETEAQLDERLRREAEHLGVNIDRQPETYPPATTNAAKQKSQSVTTYASSEQRRRSESIVSHASHSTDLTSIYSSDIDESPIPIISIQPCPSLSVGQYGQDPILTPDTPYSTWSWTFPPQTVAVDAVSSVTLSQPESPSAPPKRHFRRIRKLSKLKPNRQEMPEDRNRSCSRGPSPRKAKHQSPCGHRLCIHSLRSCRRIPGPEEMAGHDMTHVEPLSPADNFPSDAALAALTALPTYPSGQSTPSPPSLPPRPTLHPLHTSRAPSTTSRTDSFAPSPTSPIPSIPIRPELQALLTAQSSQHHRFTAWTRTALTALEASHASRLSALHDAHALALSSLRTSHALALAEAEDKQVSAEADLRAAHAQAEADTRVALRQMEAFCAGVYTDGRAHGREVSERERAELERAKRAATLAARRREAEIEILRNEQGRRLGARERRAEGEVRELEREQRREVEGLEREMEAEIREFEEGVEEKGERMRWRCELERGILAARIEGEQLHKRKGRVEAVEWGETLQRMIGDVQGMGTELAVPG